MKLKETPKSLGIVIQIGQDPLLIDTLLQDIAFFSWRKYYFLEK